MSDLKPCPFCGSNSAVFVREDKPFPYRVQCLNDDCACRTDNYKKYRFAIEAWNKRVDDEAEKKGEWVLLDECANSGYYCSKCKKKLVKEGWSNTVKKINFCPNCGADMREGEKG